MSSTLKADPKTKSFGPQGDTYLNRYYESLGSATTRQKINAVRLKLGREQWEVHTEHEETELACLEHALLEREGQIEIVRA